MRLSFLRESEVCYLGGRSVGIGPLRLRWGGRWYVAAPLSFLAVLQTGNLLAAEGLLSLIEHAPSTWPADVLRVLAPLVIGQSLRARDLARATEPQLQVMAQALTRANDWPRLIAAMTLGSGKETDMDALDVSVAWIGRQFGLWPYKVMAKPYVEVEAVMEMLRRENGEASRDAVAFVKEKQAALDAERQKADEKLRSLGLGVDGA